MSKNTNLFPNCSFFSYSPKILSLIAWLLFPSKEILKLSLVEDTNVDIPLSLTITKYCLVERFGITLEALSYGVPVLVTNKVGSKDLVCHEEFTKGEVIELSKDIMKNKIEEFYKDRLILQKYNYNIVNDNFLYSLDKHCTNLYIEYKKLLEV